MASAFPEDQFSAFGPGDVATLVAELAALAVGARDRPGKPYRPYLLRLQRTLGPHLAAPIPGRGGATNS